MAVDAKVMVLGSLLSAVDKMNRAIDQAIEKSSYSIISFERKITGISNEFMNAGDLMAGTGTEKLDVVAEKVQKFNIVLSQETTMAYKHFKDNLRSLEISIQGLNSILEYQYKNIFASQVIPRLDKLTIKTTKVIEKVKEWISENPVLADTIAIVTLGLNGFFKAGELAKDLTDKFNDTITKFTSSWNNLIGLIDLGKTTFLKVKNSMFLFRIQYAALVIWQKLAAAAQWLFNASLFGCPVVWIIGAIIAIGAAVYLLIKHWDKVTEFFSKLWDWVKNIFSAAWEWIKGVWSGSAEWFLGLWDKITTWFSSLWDKVKAVFSMAWEWIKSMFLNYTPHGLIITHWDTIIAWFGTLWDNVTAVFVLAWEGIVNYILSIPERFMSGLSNIWETLNSWFTNLKTKFTEWGGSIIQGLIDGIMSRITAVIDAISNVGKTIKEKFTSFLGISSPSRIFAEYGLNITQGLTGGIETGTGDAVGAMQGLAMQAIQAANSGIASNTTSVSNIDNSAFGGVTFNYSPVVNVSGGSEPQGIVQQLSNQRREIERMIENYFADRRRLAFVMT